jgi:DNA invertase Pin-like site-specific DNA recombinase
MDASLNTGTALVVTHGPIRAAQYVRMSTDHQRYSIDNQAQVIRAYADRRGMIIVRTYADQGKSGLNITHRQALKQLIKDVITGEADFATILVYDVSRWGRFQDADESAHYEFICRQAGIRVEYCAELFENDGTPISTILKSLKRLMAAEYSRELSTKIFTAQCRIAAMGFRLGGVAGYGLRRLLVDESRVPKSILRLGHWKSIATDRIILIPGPSKEVAMVRRIFSMFVHKRMSEARIAKALNERGFVTDCDRPWRPHTIEWILRNEKYVGNNVWNRRSFKLKKARKRNPPEAWLRVDGAFKAVVDRSLFDEAQAILQARRHFTWTGRPRGFSNEQMLDALRRLFEEHGYLSIRLINQAEGIPAYSVYVARFGGLKQAYAQVGYDCRRYRLLMATRRCPNEEMLKRLRRLLDKHGYLSTCIIDNAKGLPSACVYRSRFGSLFKAYEMIGYTSEYNRSERPRYLPDEAMLEGLRHLLAERGQLTQKIIRSCSFVPTPDAYRKRFGSLMHAYRLIGLIRDKYAPLSSRPRGLSTEEMLEALRKLFRERGRLSLRLIGDCKQMPSAHQYEARFGGIMQAYELIGYKVQPRALGGAASRGKRLRPRCEHPA